jgi:hypothetical protein
MLRSSLSVVLVIILSFSAGAAPTTAPTTQASPVVAKILQVAAANRTDNVEKLTQRLEMTRQNAIKAEKLPEATAQQKAFKAQVLPGAREQVKIEEKVVARTAAQPLWMTTPTPTRAKEVGDIGDMGPTPAVVVRVLGDDRFVFKLHEKQQEVRGVSMAGKKEGDRILLGRPMILVGKGEYEGQSSLVWQVFTDEENAELLAYPGWK